MTATFDLYTKRSRAYYLTGRITVAMLIVAIATGLTNPQLPKFLMWLIEGFIIFGALTMPVFLMLAITGWFVTYVKDGELVLSDDYLIIDNIKISVAEARKIKLRPGFSVRGRRAGNIVSNRIEVIDKDGNTYKRRFVLMSVENSEAFDKITGEWYKKGYVDLVYHSI
jgi:hypothetical protein